MRIQINPKYDADLLEAHLRTLAAASKAAHEKTPAEVVLDEISHSMTAAELVGIKARASGNDVLSIARVRYAKVQAVAEDERRKQRMELLRAMRAAAESFTASLDDLLDELGADDDSNPASARQREIREAKREAERKAG